MNEPTMRVVRRCQKFRDASGDEAVIQAIRRAAVEEDT